MELRFVIAYFALKGLHILAQGNALGWEHQSQVSPEGA
jgi:hypothetical protein